MREIKFRAWDSFHKEFVYWIILNQVLFSEILVKSGAKLNKWEQFTGLKDKNGKEIYEGDIVYNEADKYNYQIIWNEREARFTLGEDSGPLSTYVLGTFWEVIGNIHENPELIN